MMNRLPDLLWRVHRSGSLRRIFAFEEAETGRYYEAVRQYFDALSTATRPTPIAGEELIQKFTYGDHVVKHKRRLLYRDEFSGGGSEKISKYSVLSEHFFSLPNSFRQIRELRKDVGRYTVLVHEEAVSKGSLSSDMEGIRISGEELKDEFDGHKFKWQRFCTDGGSSRYELSFRNSKTSRVLRTYLPRVLTATTDEGAAGEVPAMSISECNGHPVMG